MRMTDQNLLVPMLSSKTNKSTLIGHTGFFWHLKLANTCTDDPHHIFLQTWRGLFDIACLSASDPPLFSCPDNSIDSHFWTTLSKSNPRYFKLVNTGTDDHHHISVRRLDGLFDIVCLKSASESEPGTFSLQTVLHFCQTDVNLPFKRRITWFCVKLRVTLCVEMFPF